MLNLHPWFIRFMLVTEPLGSSCRSLLRSDTTQRLTAKWLETDLKFHQAPGPVVFTSFRGRKGEKLEEPWENEQCLDQRTKQEETVINTIYIHVCWALLCCRSCDLQQRLFKGINPQPAKEDNRACLFSSEDKSNSASSGLKKLI